MRDQRVSSRRGTRGLIETPDGQMRETCVTDTRRNRELDLIPLPRPCNGSCVVVNLPQAVSGLRDGGSRVLLVSELKICHQLFSGSTEVSR